MQVAGGMDLFQPIEETPQDALDLERRKVTFRLDLLLQGYAARQGHHHVGRAIG